MSENLKLNFMENESFFNDGNRFWFINSKGDTKIIQTKLIDYIESLGFRKVKLSNDRYILVRLENNLVSKSSEPEIISLIRDHLVHSNENEAYEVFAKGLGAYIYGRKMDLLTEVELINDQDEFHYSRFYFQNGFVEVSKESVDYKSYEELESPIWRDRIIQREFTFPEKQEGQFEQFCIDITGGKKERFFVLKSLLGYLLHRNKERGETQAIILYDEEMTNLIGANGGTGKTLLSQALKECRELVLFNGKEIKEGSWFVNQQIELTTDILLYDDLKKGFNLEHFFPLLTTGVEIEKKRQQSFTIDFEQSPKVIITSNYIVSGPGGSSDRRRRNEFEVHNYYSAEFRPEDKFRNRFFNKQWPAEEWNLFYRFMMECVQVYLQEGMLKAEPLNLEKSKIITETSTEFFEFAEAFVDFDRWIDKREFDALFRDWCEDQTISPHIITKWVKSYSNEIGGDFKIKSSGGNYEFIVRKEEFKNEDGNNLQSDQ